MKVIPACRGREGMEEHPASGWLAGFDECFPGEEILPGLLLIPGGCVRGERLQRWDSMSVARDAPRMSRAFREKDWLDVLAKVFKIERRWNLLRLHAEGEKIR